MRQKSGKRTRRETAVHSTPSRDMLRSRRWRRTAMYHCMSGDVGTATRIRGRWFVGGFVRTTSAARRDVAVAVYAVQVIVLS